MKEIMSLHVGQAGIQVGHALWELLCAEHSVSQTGILSQQPHEIECLDTFFSQAHSGRLIPRCIFVDLEASVIDEIKRGSYKTLFHPDRLISGPEDAASNFARGFFTVGKLLLGIVSHEIRKLNESADNTQAILIYRSLGGGTGSGLTSAIFDSLADYPKLTKIEIPIYPSPTLSTAMVEPYNCLLGEHFCMEDIDIGLLLDNEALYDICSKYLSIYHPTYNTINRLVTQVISSLTASIRFESVMNCDLTVLQTNLVPYPRIHFPLANFAPIVCASKAIHEELTVLDLTRAVFDKENQMMKIDHSFGRFMSCSLMYRGEVSPYNVYIALNNIKKDKNIEFVDWCPTGFKVGINVCPPTIVPASEIYPTSKNVAMLANTSAIGQAWQRLTHKFYLLYSKRSFVHWFVGEGMEECEFTEALYNISALVKDYEEVTLDRNFETETPGENTENADKVDQSNTGYAENVKEDVKKEEGRKKFNAEEERKFVDEQTAENNEDEENEDNVEEETQEAEETEEETVEEEIVEEANTEEANAEKSEEENIEEANVEEAVEETTEETPEGAVEQVEEEQKEETDDAVEEGTEEGSDEDEKVAETATLENDEDPNREEESQNVTDENPEEEVEAADEASEPEEVEQTVEAPEETEEGQDPVEDDEEGQDAVEDDEGGQDAVEDNEGGQDAVEDIEEGPDAVEDIEEGPDAVEDIEEGPDEVADNEKGPDVLEENEEGPEVLEDTEEGPDAVEYTEEAAEETDEETEESARQRNAAETVDENDEVENLEENQNNIWIDNGETSNNCELISDLSNACSTVNDNTLDNIRASLIRDNILTRKFYSAFM